MKVLVVDDDADLVDVMTYTLRREGYSVTAAMDGAQALSRWETDEPDIILLDGNLPKFDGFEVCRRIRSESQTPIIMLTARDEEEDIVRGLQLGADDYVVKPFSSKQLTARMKTVLRRAKADPYAQPSSEVVVGDLTLDLQSHEVTKAGKPIQLTRMEFRILYMLAVNAGHVIPYSRLVEYAWGYYEGGDPALLKAHICHIRKKLNMPPGKQGVIQAVFGVGYRLAKPAKRP